jgi:acyl CoA:acetate/3-ketoacid CoA transferase alpha subunit/acyl CoA:acetate/3-ketoacid CoA transferase beta subunit
MEIVRQFSGTRPGFTLSTCGLVSVQHALVARGLVRRLVASFAGENYPAPRPSKILQQAIAEGAVEIENWSMWTLVARLVAGALGVEFFPVSSFRDSSLELEHVGTSYARLESPFPGGGPTGVVSSYRPDVVIVQAIAADPEGNLVMAAPFGEAYWGALAARHGVIACVEEVVAPERLRAQNSLVTIPGHVVVAVCEVPFGSHPYGSYNPGLEGVASYSEDHDFIVETQQRSRDMASFDEWIDEWVMGVRDHEGYLRKLGGHRLATLRGEAAPDVWRFEGYEQPEPSGPTDAERLVVTAAHVLTERVRECQHQTILAGVGYANLAAWLAADTLRAEGRSVELMAEIGMFGYSPRPGEPFIFALRNLPTNTLLSDVMAVLGTFVSGPATRCLGALGSGQVDRQGRLNSTWSDDGRFLVGSGGANDIASSADEVVAIVMHSRTRLVEEVPYVTSPGDRVRAIVTNQGILERVDGEFQLVGYVARQDESARETVQRIVTDTGWDVRIGTEVSALPEPTPAELRLLRAFDPRRTFLG